MATTWRTLLADLPARWQDDTLLGFPDPDAEIAQALAGDLICPLPSIGIIEAAGSDVLPFLQGQLSNDVQALADGSSRLAAYCSPKGRMLALLRVIRQGESYLLLLPKPLLEPTLKRLRMYVLRAKVTLDDGSDRRLALGISGDDAMTRLAGSGLTLPDDPDNGCWRGQAGIWRLRGERSRALLLAPVEDMARLWPALGGVPPVGEPAWRLLDVRAGVPDILPGAQESFIPQTVNLDLLGGISFTKGCYPGQEIVARMHYLGNLKRRMYRLVVATSELPTPGTDVRDAGGALAGQVVMAAPAPDGQIEALAVLQMDRAGAADLAVGGHPVRVLPPPYLAAAGG